MSSNRFRQIALGLPGVIEGSHQGHADFRAGERISRALILHRINFCRGFLSRRRAYFLSVHRHDSSGLIACNPAIRGGPTGARR
jgi:hypothetical protein